MGIDVLLARLEILHRALVLQYIPLSLNILVLLSIDLDIVSEVHKNHMHCNNIIQTWRKRASTFVLFSASKVVASQYCFIVASVF